MAPLRSLGNIASAFDDFYGRTGKEATNPSPHPFSYTTTIPNAPGILTDDSPLSFNGNTTTGVTHTITFNNPVAIQFKAFGGGGGVGDSAAPDNGVGGSGGFTYATLNLTGGVTYKLFAGGHGTSGSGGNNNPIRYGGGGGAGSGIIIDTAGGQSGGGTLLAIAGGGGGGSGRQGGSGGGTTGGEGGSPWGSGGGGGTQSAVGAGGPGNNATDGSPGSGTNGGGGADNNPPIDTIFPGGTSGITGYYDGGRGHDDGNDQGGGGGGGGYYGGGGGGASADASGGGGGSGYYNPLYSSSGSLYNGGVPMWTNDSQRSGMSGSATAGRIVINAPPAQDYFSATGTYTHIPGNTTSNGSDYFVFTGPGSVITNTTWEFEVLLVGAGGAGGSAPVAGRGGGGGAGGIQHYTNFSMESGTHSIEVGSGDSTITASGQSIVLTAKQGGTGGTAQNGNGVPGGSGGGAGSRSVGVGNGTGGTATQPDQSLVSGMGGSNWGNDGGGSTDAAGGAGGSAGSSSNAKAFPNFGTDNIGPALAAPTHPYITTSGNYGKGGPAGTYGNAGAHGAFYGAGGGGSDTTLNAGNFYPGIVILRWIRGQSTL